ELVVELVVELVFELVFEVVVELVDFGECEPDEETAGELFCGLLLEAPLLGEGLAAGKGGAAGEFPAGVPSEEEPGSNGTPLITLKSPENFSPLPSLITNIYTPGVTLTFHCLLNLVRSSESSIVTSSFVSLLRIFKVPAIVGEAPSIDQVIVNVAVVERVPVGVLTTTSII
ncbi:9899_t:CDS:2, partial [Gigaspora margarita]